MKRYLSENPGITIPERQAVSFDRPRTTEKKTGETVEETYRLLTKGMSMEEIARERNLSQSTISGHIEKLIKNGRDIEIDRIIEPAKRRRIEELFMTTKQWGLGAVVEQGEDAVAYEEARIVRAWMERKEV
ncbi:MAG: helix-turn-helix domain-containing protein [Deltaproteobacteria bacterium]|nr:helix-turn-helix domain-containing protein [Deltaproteobacteria bacterium]